MKKSIRVTPEEEAVILEMRKKKEPEEIEVPDSMIEELEESKREQEAELQERVDHKLNVIRSTILGTEELIEPIKEGLPERTQQNTIYEDFSKEFCLKCDKNGCLVFHSNNLESIKMTQTNCMRRLKIW